MPALTEKEVDMLQLGGKYTFLWVNKKYVRQKRKVHDTHKISPRVAFWVDRHFGPKISVFVWESDFKKMNSEQFMNSKVKILGKRLYSPS